MGIVKYTEVVIEYNPKEDKILSRISVSLVISFYLGITIALAMQTKETEIIITQEQINTLARYLGCECGYAFLSNRDVDTFNIEALGVWSKDGCTLDFKLLLKPLSSLTQEDFEKLGEYLEWQKGGISRENWLKVIDINDLAWRIADWLRNHGYYLGEESIKEFVKLKE